MPTKEQHPKKPRKALDVIVLDYLLPTNICFCMWKWLLEVVKIHNHICNTVLISAWYINIPDHVFTFLKTLGLVDYL